MGYIERSFGRGNLWTLSFGIGFLIWGIIAVRFPNTPGSYWMFIPGGILLIVSISNILSYRYNREKVLGALKSYQRVQLNQLSEELRMKKRDLKEMIVGGELTYYFEGPEIDLEKVIWKDDGKDKTTQLLNMSIDILEKVENWNSEEIKNAIWPMAEEEGKGSVLWPIRYTLSGKQKSPDGS